mgnify:CR=1 FL=1
MASSLKGDKKMSKAIFFILLGIVILYSVHFFVFGLWVLKYGDLPIKTVLIQDKNSHILLMATGIAGFLVAVFFLNSYFKKD